MAYLSDKLTEAELRKLERKISAEYAEAFLEIKKRADKYFADFESDVAEKMAQVEAGELSTDVFVNWYQTKVMRNEAHQDMMLSFADRMVKADKVAAAYINDATPGIFSLNANYEGYRISQAHDGISWSIYNEETVRQLFLQDEIKLPVRTINTSVDKAWNLKKLNGALISGIIQGKSPKHLSDAFDQVQGMGRNAAIRAARTAFTGAQNAGRVDSYNRAENIGIEVMKEWMCTLDVRTRDSHRHMDGERRKPNEKFSNGLLHPGDPDGAPEEVYNCRCTLLPYLPGISDEDDRLTYKEWLDEAPAFKLLSDGTNGIIDSQNIAMKIQFFAEKNVSKQSDGGLRKSIESHIKNIDIHYYKIQHPDEFYKDWNDVTDELKERRIKHWEKEIKNFKESKKRCEEELKRRNEDV